MDENEEEKNEPTPDTEEEDTEEEATIGSLFAALDAAVARISELENRLQQCEARLDGHESGYKHEPVPTDPESGEPEPEPRNWYFRRVGKFAG